MREPSTGANTRMYRAMCAHTPTIGAPESTVATMSPPDGADTTETEQSVPPTKLTLTRWRQWATGAFFALCWFLFAVANLQTFILTGKPSPLVFGLAETLIATFFILRVPPRRISQKLSEWVVAGLGTFLPLQIGRAHV